MKEQCIYSCGSRSHVGKVREHNEDSLVVSQPLFAVADGMGGHEAGEVASEIAIQTLINHAPATLDTDALGRAVEAANRAVIDAARNGVGRYGMGTTMTAAMLEGHDLSIAHVGDSRAYLLHQGQLQRLTRDHSYVSELVESGEITEEEARWHPQRSMITRALGNDPAMRPDLYEIKLQAGDRLLLCSDGLYGMLSDNDLLGLLISDADPQRCADRLVDAANAAGGADNITVIVLDIPDDSAPSRQYSSVDKPSKNYVRSQRGKRGGAGSHRGLIILIAAIVLAFAAAAAGIWGYARNSAYLINENGSVAVYRGLIGDVCGINLNWYVEDSKIPVKLLPSSVANRLKDGIAVDNLDAAFALVDSYREDYASSSTTSTSSGTAAAASNSAAR